MGTLRFSGPHSSDGPPRKPLSFRHTDHIRGQEEILRFLGLPQARMRIDDKGRGKPSFLNGERKKPRALLFTPCQLEVTGVRGVAVMKVSENGNLVVEATRSRFPFGSAFKNTYAYWFSKGYVLFFEDDLEGQLPVDLNESLKKLVAELGADEMSALQDTLSRLESYAEQQEKDARRNGLERLVQETKQKVFDILENESGAERLPKLLQSLVFQMKHVSSKTDAHFSHFLADEMVFWMRRTTEEDFLKLPHEMYQLFLDFISQLTDLHGGEE